MTIERITVAEFHARLRGQGVPARENAALTCPICGTVQSMASLLAAGHSAEMAERQIGFSCEGRKRNSGPWPAAPSPARRDLRGCDWTLGGLFSLHRLEVVDEDGKVHPMFEIATPDKALALAADFPA